VKAIRVYPRQSDDASGVAAINVFPNPFFGGAPDGRFVRFTRLPPRAVLRIYTLAGELVRAIEHEDDTPFEEWNLKNGAGDPVASGVYVVDLDCGELGRKMLKVSLVKAAD
jgi:hypothetical protein